ncbi:hypothetical protein KUTeg_020572 [Tegillarca granosa]|uniref:Secreted protein n=1 Tax=Tegillarca granosa TaxID=220873 RepID=A0ABQ9EDK7_TEGGR|nr:hypothetical protein KUTeg_020572 [Tegillarca granosa]
MQFIYSWVFTSTTFAEFFFFGRNRALTATPARMTRNSNNSVTVRKLAPRNTPICPPTFACKKDYFRFKNSDQELVVIGETCHHKVSGKVSASRARGSVFLKTSVKQQTIQNLCRSSMYSLLARLNIHLERINK